jgi:hypothetical protein
MSDPRAALRALIEKARTSGFTSSTSEASVFEQLVVPLLRDVLGWRTEVLEEFDRQTYSRGSGVADGVLKAEGIPVAYVEGKRIGKILAISELRSRSSFYSREEEQAMRYARRSAGMREGERWTLLTNFFHLRLFEASREERVLTFESPEELDERFDELMLLSRESVLGGQLRRQHQLRRKPEIDLEFREMLLHWRQRLAQELYDKNRGRFLEGGDLQLSDLQAAVQRLLDRLIIIQFAADVDALEDEEPLRDLLDRTAPARGARSLVQPPPLWEALLSAFQRFDDNYNTSLFAAGHILETLKIDDSCLRELLESIAGQSFRRLDADILGTTYETYLGHQLRVEDHVVSVQSQTEGRRGTGVYYTPVEVVKAIVERTVGASLANARDVSEVDNIKVVDPACGSGSFLIQAFDAFASWYEAENARRQEAIPDAPTLDQLADGPIADYGRRILERNIYGIDLDPEAVELASVNLILQAMRRGTPGLHLGRLPLILGQNLKVGNSVVPGYFRAKSIARPGTSLNRAVKARAALEEDSLHAEEEATALAVAADASRAAAEPAAADLVATYPKLASRSLFWWEAEFPEVFARSRDLASRGFAVVIGNPPWIGFQGDVEDREYLAAAYEAAVGRFDIYVPFLELACELARDGGLVGMVTPSNYFLRDYGELLRERLRDRETILEIIDFGARQLFHGATNYPAIVILRRAEPPTDHQLQYLRDSYSPSESESQRQRSLPSEGWVFWTAVERELVEHVTSRPRTETLEEVCRLPASGSRLAEGVVTGQNAVFLVDATVAASEDLERDLLRPCVKGADVARWSIPTPRRLLIYPYRNDVALTEEELAKRPNIYRWLESHRTVPRQSGGLAGRQYFDSSTKQWYELWNQRSDELLGVPKLLTPEISNRPEFALVEAGVAFTDSVTSATPSSASGYCLEYVAGILNSPLVALLHARLSVPKANGYLIFRPAFLGRLPIHRPDMESERDRRLHDAIVERVQACVQLSTEVRGVDTDFSGLVADFTITTRTLTGVTSRLEADARQSLLPLPGQLIDLGTRRDGDWLLVSGRTKTNSLFDEEDGVGRRDLLRLRLPEPLASFLEFYLPHATRFHRRASRHRTLSARAGEILLPDMTDPEMALAVEKQRSELRRAKAVQAQLNVLEREVGDLVAELYELTGPMIAAVNEFVTPAERAGEPILSPAPSEHDVLVTRK